MQLMEHEEEIDISPNIEVTETPASAEIDDVWANFKKKVATQQPSASTSAILEMRQYSEDASVDLKRNPLEFWKKGNAFPKTFTTGQAPSLFGCNLCAKRTYLF